MTIRLRLTLLYGLVFVVAGAGLLAINYALLYHNLPADQVKAATAQDIILRAQKLSTERDLTPAERDAVERVVNASPKDAKGLVAALPPKLSGPLLSNLGSSVRSHALSSLLRQSFLALGISTVIAFVLGWFVAGRVLRPIDTITETARELSASNLDQRIGLTGPDDEVKRLADTFDEMLARLDVAFTSQQRFVADASHELRTPLTIMRTELEVTLRKPHPSNEELLAMGKVLSDTVERSDELVGSLLALATSTHGLETIDHTDLAGVVRDTVGRRAAQAAQRGITVDTELDPAPLDGDRALLDRLVDNLVDNSIRHNVDDGWVRIVTSNGSDAVSVTVANTSAQPPADDPNALFEPFHRATRGHDAGHGLGLAIVRSIALAHRGKATITTAGDGRFEISVTLPIRPPLD